MKFAYIILILSSTLFGCAAKQEITSFNTPLPQKVCIAKHDAVKQGFLEALIKGLESHRSETKIVRGIYEEKHGMYYPRIDLEEVEDCDAIAFYVANWHWDLALYMRFANIWITDKTMSKKIAQATYTTGGGPDKFINAENKVLELVTQMYSTQIINK
ncbi:Sbal_3080 family lipoprotein [Colwellia sp. UCD-KL20]|uniref:Sbal_3080 family lipoprotein n=1 Tax=Colwellia sp. UCD-KL20 TaxID=1917165 RepID=UPI0009713809|nr:Sbal_3080 family lipoprotein [Colwellia sp. UCD-KL20]